MTIAVRLFAAARQACDRSLVQIDAPGRATVAELRRLLAQEYPQLAPILPHCLFAAESQYVDDGYSLADGDELACIPPVSGG